MQRFSNPGGDATFCTSVAHRLAVALGTPLGSLFWDASSEAVGAHPSDLQTIVEPQVAPQENSLFEDWENKRQPLRPSTARVTEDL